ncbi:nitroreductase family protein [candidate division KSB1 bacterium]
MVGNTDISKIRKTNYPADRIFIDRWSPRAMSGELMTKDELMTLFEAARWAPSEFNTQPWHFVYAMKGTDHFKSLFDLLAEFNQQWCKNASALIVIISRKTFEHNNKTSRTYSFNTGAAWQNLSLQGSMNGLVVHGMSGLNYDIAAEVLGIPDDYAVEAMCAVGKPGSIEELSQEMAAREKPSGRKAVSEFVFEGRFGG